MFIKGKTELNSSTFCLALKLTAMATFEKIYQLIEDLTKNDIAKNGKQLSPPLFGRNELAKTVEIEREIFDKIIDAHYDKVKLIQHDNEVAMKGELYDRL